jgi:hypothetical protein
MDNIADGQLYRMRRGASQVSHGPRSGGSVKVGKSGRGGRGGGIVGRGSRHGERAGRAGRGGRGGHDSPRSNASRYVVEL